MTAAQRGDRLAYQDLLGELLGPLQAFARSRRVDPANVDDVVQTVLLSIHRARHTYRSERPFGPWLWTIARNAVTDSHRARSVRLRRELPLDALATAQEPSVEMQPRDALSPALQAGLDALPATQREAVELLHVHQLTVAEAAERVGVSRSALKVRAYRGRKALRMVLEDWES